MDFGLPEKTVKKIIRILEGYPQIDVVVIYGSRAKGNFSNGSDIDLTLKGEEINFEVLTDISRNIDELNLPYMVDLSIYSHIDNKNLLDHIDRVGKIFYQQTISS